MDYHQDKQESISLWISKKQAYYSLQRWCDMKTILTQTYFWKVSIMEIIEIQFHLKRRLEVFPLDIFAPVTWNEASKYFHGPTAPCRQSVTLDASVLSFMPMERVTEPKSTGCPLSCCKGKKRKLFSKQQPPLDQWWELRSGRWNGRDIVLCKAGKLLLVSGGKLNCHWLKREKTGH